MVYGYARVSSKGQDRYGSSLDIQETELRKAGADCILRESFTGTKKHRPELDKLLGMVCEGDTVVVTKLDRMARSTIDGLVLIDEFLAKGVDIHILNMGKFDDTPTGKLMRTVFLGFAEFERDMIASRTAEGKAKRRSENPDWKEGRKRLDIPDFQKFFQKQKDGLMTVDECCSALGISRSTWYARVKEVSS